jgi:hypothetical protein
MRGARAHPHWPIIFQLSLLCRRIHLRSGGTLGVGVTTRLTCPLNNQWLLCSSIVKLAGAFLNFFMIARAKRW